MESFVAHLIFAIDGVKGSPILEFLRFIIVCVVLLLNRSSLVPTNHNNNNSFSIYRIESNSYVFENENKRERNNRNENREEKKHIGPPLIWCALYGVLKLNKSNGCVERYDCLLFVFVHVRSSICVYVRVLMYFTCWFCARAELHENLGKKQQQQQCHCMCHTHIKILKIG